MRYFQDRKEAGQLLAAQLHHYAPTNCAVLALSEGGAIVGAEIAKAIHASLYMLAIEDIILPRELEPLAAMSTAGTFTYNHSLSPADLEEATSDYRPVIDKLRLETFQKLNRVISKDGVIDKEFLKRHVVIVVSDGISNGLSVDVASDFLKPVLTQKVIVATPLCSPDAVEQIRAFTDEFFYLSLVEPGFPLSHYYQDNTMPGHEEVLQLMSNISLEW